MEERDQINRAMEILRGFVSDLAVQAGQSQEYGEELWRAISSSGGFCGSWPIIMTMEVFCVSTRWPDLRWPTCWYGRWTISSFIWTAQTR